MDLSDPPAGTAPAPAAPAGDVGRYAIGGTSPRSAYRPASPEEAAEIVRACAADGLSLVPWGGGVALARETAPTSYDVALDLGALNRITIHEVEDYTVSAECGITLADLGAALEARGQELPIEAAESWGATLGGALAANASGARRLRFGSPRDRLLGARFVTGDGVLARTGGRVVKNVAGHAVHRLLAGSRGGLGVLLEASLKLLPAPTARLASVWAADAALLADEARWRDVPRREPAGLTVLGRALASLNPVLAADAPFAIVMGFEHDAPWLESCAAFARDRLGAARVTVRDASVPPLWRALADAEEMPGPRLSFTSAHVSPAAIAFLAGRTVAERLVFHAPCGRLHLWPAPEEAAALVAELAGRGFALVEARGAGVLPPEPPLAVAGLRARLREALDPYRVMALGDRWQREGGR